MGGGGAAEKWAATSIINSVPDIINRCEGATGVLSKRKVLDLAIICRT